MPRINTPRRPSRKPLGLRRVKVPTIPIRKNPVAKTAPGVVE